MGNTSVKSLLNLYLKKVAAGETVYMDRLASQLAERLVYIPAAARTEDKQTNGGGIKVEALCVREDQRSLIPIFTQEKMLHDWCKERGTSAQSITLLCADFCGALAQDSWIWVNPGTEDAVELEPSMVEKIRHSSGVFTNLRQQAVPETEMGAGSSFMVEDLDPVVQEPAIEDSPRPAEPEKKRRRSLLGFLGLKA